MIEAPHPYGWYYTRGAGRRHLVDASLAGGGEARCGIAAPGGGWFGTGGQHEYDVCASLPACGACEYALYDDFGAR